MSRFRKRALIVALAVAGWILPTVWPGHGVLLGYDEPRDPDWYYSIAYLIEAGWFSPALVFEDTWEGGHGHTGPYFPWRVGQAIPLVFVASVILLAIRLPIAIFLTLSWSLAGSGLAAWGIATHYVPPFPVRSAILLSVVVVYWIAFWLVLRRQSRADARSYRRIQAALALAFYPIWLIALSATMMVPPFLGAVAYMASLAVLFSADRAAVASQPA